jgi:site-specific recombinase XerD
MTKPSFKHLILNEMEPTNKKWFEKFRAETHYTSLGYYQTIENFLKYCEFKDKTLETFTTRPDIEDYILAMWENHYSSGRTDDVIATISSFRNFLVNNCSFPQDFLSDILNLQVNEKSVPDSAPLTLSQLYHIREYNIRNITDKYIFEIYFQLGIDKKDLAICVPKNVDYEKRCFYVKDKMIRYNEKISQLISQVEVNELEVKMQNIDYHYFKKVTAHLRNTARVWEKERALNYSDILESHKIFMIKCPNPSCEELLENVQQNWVLVKTEFDTEYRLVCCRCKGKPYER